MSNSARASGVTIQAIGSIPVGSILHWPTETVPTGYLECNGSSLLRANYTELYAVIGTLYGAADGTHFNIPDYRGRFLRAWDHAKANDPDRASRTAPTATGATITAGDYVGTEQADDYKAHTHDAKSNSSGGGGVYVGTAIGTSTTQQTGTAPLTGGNETRGKNVNVMVCIKYTMEVFSFVDTITKGAADLKFFMNSAGSAAEWAKGIKICSSTFSTTTGTGDVSYTGAGFKPSLVRVICNIDSTSKQCVGYYDGTTNRGLTDNMNVSADTYVANTSSLGILFHDSTNYHLVAGKSLDSDGCTLTWTKVNSPTGGLTVNITFIYFR
jgi:microcystin-dependent protein